LLPAPHNCLWRLVDTHLLEVSKVSGRSVEPWIVPNIVDVRFALTCYKF
jgi:hypothetical protein